MLAYFAHFNISYLDHVAVGILLERCQARTEDNFTIIEGPFRSLDDTVNVFPPNVSVIFDPFIPRDYKIDPSYAEGMWHGGYS